MAGWTSYSKIDQFVLLPMQSLSLSATTFVGQNLGAGNLSPRQERHPGLNGDFSGDYGGADRSADRLLLPALNALQSG